jgi:hypothetical protein
MNEDMKSLLLAYLGIPVMIVVLSLNINVSDCIAGLFMSGFFIFIFGSLIFVQYIKEKKMEALNPGKDDRNTTN